MPNPNEAINAALVASLADESGRFNDTVALATPLLAILKRKGRITPFSGPLIRERILYGRPVGGFYRGYEFLNTSPADLLTMAEYTPKYLSVPASISGQEIIENTGQAQLIDLIDATITTAKAAAREMIYKGIHSDGTGDGGRQITGLKAMLPTVANAGVYAGINRATWQWWRTGSYDISNGDIPGYTVPSKDSIIPILEAVAMKHSIGTQGPDLALMAADHFTALMAAFRDRQMITSEGESAKLNFNTVKLALGGRTIEVALEGGIGSEMPAGTTYLLDTDSLALRYHPSRNWTPSDKRRPVNQDAEITHIFWAGEFTMNNARFNAKIVN